MNLISFGEIIWDAFENSHSLGGAPLNLAAHVALLGGNSWLASAVGDDTLGENALEHIKALDIKTEFISVRKNLPTGRCDVTLSENNHPSYKIIENVAYDKISLPGTLNQAFDVLAFGTLALRSEENRETLEHILHNNSFEEIYTDLNIRPPFYSKESIEFCLANASIVKISDEELPTVTEQLFGEVVSCDKACALIKNRYPKINLILITLGKNGAVCYDCRCKKIYHCKAEAATVVSTVGAGDSYGAAFLTWYFKTKDIMQSMSLASKVSAFVVSHQEAIPAGTKDFLKSVTQFH